MATWILGNIQWARVKWTARQYVSNNTQGFNMDLFQNTIDTTPFPELKKNGPMNEKAHYHNKGEKL